MSTAVFFIALVASLKGLDDMYHSDTYKYRITLLIACIMWAVLYNILH